MNIKILIGVVIIVVAGYFLLRDTEPEVSVTPNPVVETPTGDPAFTWEYAEFVKDEFPYSTITLAATYPNGTIIRKEVGEVQGGCEDYPDPDTDVYGSTMIMCYYAGFGEYFKVVKTLAGYDVRHKEFEEGSPDYNPPVMEYETVATF